MFCTSDKFSPRPPLLQKGGEMYLLVPKFLSLFLSVLCERRPCEGISALSRRYSRDLCSARFAVKRPDYATLQLPTVSLQLYPCPLSSAWNQERTIMRRSSVQKGELIAQFLS